MELNNYVDTVRQGVRDAAALADDQSRQVAERLGQALDASTRLALISALSDAAAEISTELAPGSVELKLGNGEPHFSVTAPPESTEATMILPTPDESESDASPSAEEGDSPTARISLRLPLSVKERVDRAADAEGVSTNTWLIRAVQDALEPARQRSGAPWSPGGIGQIFGPDGPFGAHGVFGPHGPFGPGDPRREHRPDPPTDPTGVPTGDPSRDADVDPRVARLRRAARDWSEGHVDKAGRGGRPDSWSQGWGGRGRVQGWVR